MKHLLLLIGLCGCWGAQAEETPDLEKTLMDTILPSIALEDEPLDKALEWLRQQLLERAGADVTIEWIKPEDLGQPKRDAPTVTLRLTNVPAVEGLRYITDLARTQYRIWNQRIVITPLGVEAQSKALFVTEAHSVYLRQFKEFGAQIVPERGGGFGGPESGIVSGCRFEKPLRIATASTSWLERGWFACTERRGIRDHRDLQTGAGLPRDLRRAINNRSSRSLFREHHLEIHQTTD